MEPRYDTFWTSTYKGWAIHGKYDRQLHKEIIEIQKPDNTFIRHKASTLDGCKRVINRAIKGEQ